MSDDLGGDLRRIMREHDREAPSSADLRTALRDAPSPERRPARSVGRRRYAPFAAAAAVAVVIAGSVWAGAHFSGLQRVIPRHHRVASPPLACPAQYAHAAPWVPAKPSGVPARSRLAPRRKPASAVICGYAGKNIGPQGGWQLSGRRVLRSNLAGLASDLAWEPRKLAGQQIPCFLVAGPQVNYLIGLTYAGRGRLWVTATKDPNECVWSSNGEFTSFGVIGGLVNEAFKSGRWPARHPASCGGGDGPGRGRLGQDQAMVPPGAISVSICDGHGGPTRYSGFAGLVSALNSLPTRPSDQACHMTHRGAPVHYLLAFGYRQGAAVEVSVFGRCMPQVNNGNLQAVSAATILPIITRLLR